MDMQSAPDSEGRTASSGESKTFVDRAGIGFGEFIFLIAALSSIVGLSIDIMLPVLPLIGDSFAVTNENDRQAIIVVFMLGFGGAQIFFGPLSDRYGRNIILIPAILFYAGASVAAIFADSFTVLLALRLAQGVGAAAVRIVVMAIVRDCFAGRDMARVMSYTFTIFMIVPVVAPALGQWISNIASWQWIFLVLGFAGMALAAWSGLRMGYTLGATLCFSGLIAFVVSAQQIFQSMYDLGQWFAFAFALNAAVMAVLNIANGAIVRTVGMRLISHSALIAFALLGTLLLLISLAGQPPFWVSYVLLAAIVGAFGLVPGNFNALAMEPLGHIAGTASSVLGVITFTVGAVLGGLVGQAYNGTLIPLAAGLALFGWLALAIVLWTEKGKLFVNPAGPR